MASLYLNPDLDPAVAVGDTAPLQGEEARHAVAVARVRAGERIAIGDGRGTVAWGTVESAANHSVEMTVEAVTRDPAPSPAIWLAQALAKGDRDELAVQAATELGAAGVIPWAAERSVPRWAGPKATRGQDRWRSIVAEATKQAIRSHIPEVADLATVTDLAALPGTVLVLDPTAPRLLTEVALTGERLTLVVGPEGGIAPRELDALAEAGAIRVRLGPEILRTSTAGPAALAVLNVRLSRW